MKKRTAIIGYTKAMGRMEAKLKSPNVPQETKVQVLNYIGARLQLAAISQKEANGKIPNYG